MSKIYKLRNIISIFCTNTEESTRKIAKKSRKRYLQGSWSENCHLCFVSISVLLDLLSNVYINLKLNLNNAQGGKNEDQRKRNGMYEKNISILDTTF